MKPTREVSILRKMVYAYPDDFRIVKVLRKAIRFERAFKRPNSLVRRIMAQAEMKEKLNGYFRKEENQTS